MLKLQYIIEQVATSLVERYVLYDREEYYAIGLAISSYFEFVVAGSDRLIMKRLFKT